MRIAMISDIHANVEAFKTVIEHMKDQRVDEVIFLGDLVMNGPYPKEVLAMMSDLAPIVWVKGNTDNWFEEIDEDFIPVNEREEYICSLYQYAKERLTKDEIQMVLSKTEKQLIEVEGLKILCAHGSHKSISEPIGIMTPQGNIEQLIKEVEADILLCGHTHLPYYVSFNGKKIINGGAVSLSLDGDASASYGIIEISQKSTSYINHKLDYNLEKVMSCAKSNDFPYVDMYIKRLKEAK
ncbi:metallophosphoesterase family protein [Anaerosolibacter sp.]|uniref:metallophosphoesterase family protein n=1 Tax=Anaerosolibacter sp. TaxID=1872527 RepID=UPI0039F117A4